MSVLALTLLPVSIAIIFLSVVILNAKRTKSMFVFVFLLLSFIGWSIANYFSLVADSNEDIFYWMQVVMFITTYLFLFVIEFANYFPDEKGYLSRSTLLLLRGSAIVISILAINGLIISDATISSDGQITPVFGPLIPFYGGFTFISVSGAGYILYKKTKQGNEFSRRKIRYMAAGLITTTVLGVTTNLIFVLLGQTNFVALGPTFLLILLTSIFVLVISGEIFDLRLVFGQLTYFTLMTLYSALFFVAMLLINSNLFEDVFSPEAIILSFVTTIVFVYSYNLINRFINKKVSISIINAGYDQNAVIADLTNELGQILDYKLVIELVLKKVTSLLSIDSSYVWVSYNNINDDIFINLEDETKTAIPEKIKQSLMEMFSDRGVLDTNGIFTDFVLNNQKNYSYQAVQIANTAEELGVKVIFPINKSDEVVGLVFIGEKQNSVPFTDNEQSFLHRIFKLLNTSLVRSLLYEDVNEFNVTLQKKIDEATEELKIANLKLADSLRKEKDMMDILGHELRTPLGTARNAILVLDSLRKENKLEQDKLDKYMKIAVDNIRREKDMLEVILQSARLENSRLQITYTQVSVDEILDSALNSFKNQAEKKKLILTIDNQTEGVFVKADRTAIQQAIDNFTSNAVKYTAHGQITIFSEKVDDGHIRLGVKDTGEGISKEDIQHIGKKFFRANPYLVSGGKIGDQEIVRPGGTGIGMYVVKGILEAMGTILEIQSELGKGSTFSAVFEIASSDDQSISPQEQEKPLG